LAILDQIEKAGAPPFFLHVAYDPPHPPYFVPAPYDKLVDPGAVELPDPGEDANRPAWQFAARERAGTLQATEADIRRLIATYYGMIAYADDQMQRVYCALKDRGLLRNTWIIVGSDHGDYTGEKGLFAKSQSLYECLLHVPLIICPPADAKWPRGKRVPHFVDLADLFPTILGLAGVQVPEYAQGKDLVSWVRDGAAQPLRGCVFAQVGDYHGERWASWGQPGRRHASLVQGARTTDFSYVRDPDYGHEAYDLQADPQELHNLLGSRGGAEPSEITELRRRIGQWEEECFQLRERLGVVPGCRGFEFE
jgi:arylsulfatase A-like enzyme